MLSAPVPVKAANAFTGTSGGSVSSVAASTFSLADSAGSAAAPVFPFRDELPPSVARLSLVPDDEPRPAVPQNLAAPRELLVGKPSRARGARPVLPGCFGEVPLIKAENGRLPAKILCTLWDGEHQLRADAAVSLAKLNIAYQQRFGKPMCVADGYRTIGEQYTVRALRGWFAASPGTSNHGWGVAVDFCGGIENSGSVEYRWMVENASRYGWGNPDWALPGGSGPTEPWHWEYSVDGESE